MIVLLIAYDINHLVDGKILITEFGGTDILCHIYRSAVAAQKQLVVKTGIGKVGPYRAVILPVHDALVKSFEHFLLALEIGIALVVYLVEVHAETLVGSIEACIDPIIHHFPQSAHLRVFVLPAAQHLAGLKHERRRLFSLFLRHAFIHQLFYLGFIVLVKEYIKVTYEMVALFAGRLGSSSLAPLAPSKHRLAYVYAAVVDYIGLYDTVAACLEYLRQAVAEQIVAHVSEMERLVSVGRRVFHHDQRTFGSHGHCAIVGSLAYVAQHRHEVSRLNDYVEEALYDVVAVYCRLVVHKPVTYLLANGFRGFACGFHPRKYHYRKIAFKLFLGSLGHY